MDLDAFPVPTLLGIHGPFIAQWPPDPDGDYEAWWAQTGPGMSDAVPIPLAVVREMAAVNSSGRVYEWLAGDPNPWERIRGELNAAAQRVRDRIGRARQPDVSTYMITRGGKVSGPVPVDAHPGWPGP